MWDKIGIALITALLGGLAMPLNFGNRYKIFLLSKKFSVTVLTLILFSVLLTIFSIRSDKETEDSNTEQKKRYETKIDTILQSLVTYGFTLSPTNRVIPITTTFSAKNVAANNYGQVGDNRTINDYSQRTVTTSNKNENNLECPEIIIVKSPSVIRKLAELQDGTKRPQLSMTFNVKTKNITEANYATDIFKAAYRIMVSLIMIMINSRVTIIKTE